MTKSEINDRRPRVGQYLADLLTGRAPLCRVFWVGVVGSGATLFLVGLLIRTADSWIMIAGLFSLWLLWSLIVIWRAGRHSHPIARYPSRILWIAFIAFVVVAPGLCFTGTQRVNLWEAVMLSNSHRVALQIACVNGTLRPGLTNEDEEFGLGAPEAYASTYTHSVTTRATGGNTARVEILLKRISDTLLDGQTVVLEGHCADAQMHWKVSGDIPRKYREQLARVIE